KEDLSLGTRLAEELPGIFLWSVEGWRRLAKRGYFVQPKSGDALVRELEDLASPVRAFVREKCKLGAGLSVKKTTLYLAWERWCRTKGFSHPTTEPVFGRDLRAAFSTLREGRFGPREGSRVRYYVGLSLISPG
ncbi:MAG: hypothetical protein ABR915_07740, partial [Thermoguttaceae bacterium]